jgi:hypothetical protein
MTRRKLNLQRAALEEHKRLGKNLLPPFRQFNPSPEQVFWCRDLLPEFLWIDSLVHTYGEAGAAHLFGAFISAADHFNLNASEILDGTISSFRLIGADGRDRFLEELPELITDAVRMPFGSVLSIYPECPMAWMGVGKDRRPQHADADTIRSAIQRLLPGKDSHAGFCRALPLHRLLAHGKVKIFANLTDTIEAIKTYPHGDRYRAETFARSLHNQILMKRAKDDPAALQWSRSFWNANLSLAPCVYG